jgi:hypothetical protein
MDNLADNPEKSILVTPKLEISGLSARLSIN